MYVEAVVAPTILEWDRALQQISLAKRVRSDCARRPHLRPQEGVAVSSSHIAGEYARIETALNTPTLRLLDRVSAGVALPIFSCAFTHEVQSIPVERFHGLVEVLLDELRSAGYPVPSSSAKSLVAKWVRDEKWLYRDPGRGEETYQLTGAAREALDYVNRATRTQLNMSLSRIETMRRVVAETALAANPDRDERKLRLAEDIAQLQAEYERLDSGGELVEASESELTERFSNVLRELDGLPSDFRRVEEAMRDMHRQIAKGFREDDRPIGEVVDDYLNQSADLMTATPEGRAFGGALELFRKPDWLTSLRNDLHTILSHPWAGTLLPLEQNQLRSTVDVIRRGRDDVLAQRQQLSATLHEHIENYDHIQNRELDATLRDLDREIRAWMLSARARDHVLVELIPPALDLDSLKLRTFDPDDERSPAPLQDRSDETPEALSLEQIRTMGGPSLPALRQRLEQELSAGSLESAAKLFNDLPSDLRRPVEILGVLHLFARIGIDVDTARREEIQTVRSDGSARRFAIPVTTVATDTADADNTGSTHEHTDRTNQESA